MTSKWGEQHHRHRCHVVQSQCIATMYNGGKSVSRVSTTTLGPRKSSWGRVIIHITRRAGGNECREYSGCKRQCAIVCEYIGTFPVTAISSYSMCTSTDDRDFVVVLLCLSIHSFKILTYFSTCACTTALVWNVYRARECDTQPYLAYTSSGRRGREGRLQFLTRGLHVVNREIQALPVQSRGEVERENSTVCRCPTS